MYVIRSDVFLQNSSNISPECDLMFSIICEMHPANMVEARMHTKFLQLEMFVQPFRKLGGASSEGIKFTGKHSCHWQLSHHFITHFN